MADERTGRNARMSTRRITGLTRRGKPELHECRATGPDENVMGRVSVEVRSPTPYIEKI